MDTVHNKISGKKIIFLIAGILFIVGFLYNRLLEGFFQQDEWFGFGWFFLNKDLNFFEAVKFFFKSDIGHYNPLTNALQYSLSQAWGIDYTKFMLVGIFLHLLITLSVYLLATIAFKRNKLLSLMSTLVFGIFSAPYQGTAWAVVNLSTLMATLFGIISTIFFLMFLEKNQNQNSKKRITKFFYTSIFFLVLSLLFKEITIGLFPLFFIVYFWSLKKKKITDKYLLLLVVAGCIYFIVRIVMFLDPNQTGESLINQPQSLLNLVYDFATIPFKSLSQIVIPSEIDYFVAKNVATIFPTSLVGDVGSPQFERFAVRYVMEVVLLILAFVLTLLGIIVIRNKKDKDSAKIVLYSLAWIFLNSLIFSFSPGRVGKVSLVDSRNLYFTSVGAAFFTIALINFFTKKSLKFFVVLVLIISLTNIYFLNKNLSAFVDSGRIRKQILREIITLYPNLPEKVVFYTESTSSYYGLPEKEKILPFQSGLGQTLLIWYHPKENFPKGFFENRYLWGISDQSYKEIGNRGFGYFRDIDLFKQTVSNYKLSPDSIIAFSWDSENFSLQDISEDIRRSLKEYEKVK